MKQKPATKTNLKREFLRHTVATLAYRGGKSLRDAPEGFGDYLVGEGTRRPLEILFHINNLIKWAWLLAQGDSGWQDVPTRTWKEEVERFFEELKRLDDYLASEAPLGNPPEKIFQGPIADAHTHVGQMSMLRRLAGSPVRGENYFKAEIVTGRVGPEQSSLRTEFDWLPKRGGKK
ncbi:MAG: hypothetical protein L0Z48_05900 [candidate division Zixibacteria bacterium]|nr:hypothetical protein [candidate division Zixibacteria bacterium]MCI0596057.1 hypothetical protein [candidate division Zixibacteria bacterium]